MEMASHSASRSRSSVASSSPSPTYARTTASSTSSMWLLPAVDAIHGDGGDVEADGPEATARGLHGERKADVAEADDADDGGVVVQVVQEVSACGDDHGCVSKNGRSIVCMTGWWGAGGVPRAGQGWPSPTGDEDEGRKPRGFVGLAHRSVGPHLRYRLDRSPVRTKMLWRRSYGLLRPYNGPQSQRDFGGTMSYRSLLGRSWNPRLRIGSGGRSLQ
jgi:hypothetical protein